MIINNSSDFIVGKDDFAVLEIKSSGNNGFYYFYDNKKMRLIKRFILHTSKTDIKTYCGVTFIEKDGKYSPRLEFSNRKNNELYKENLFLEPTPHIISSRISLDECHENFWKLIDYIQSLRQVKVPKDGLVVMPREEKKFLEKIRVNKEFIQTILQSCSTPEVQNLLIEAQKEDVNNLFAAVKNAKNIKALEELNTLIENKSVSEYSLESWIKENDWVFGIEYTRRLDATRIGIHSDADLLVESLDGFVDLIELKLPSVKLFNEDLSHKCFYPSGKLAQVIGQTTNYISIMEDSRFTLKSEDELNILKPRAKIVIGRSLNMSNKEKEALRKLNDTLHNIEIMTYDEILHRSKRIVSQYQDKL